MVLLGTHQVFILVIYVQASSTQKECYRFNPGGGFDSFCCDNHIRLNGVCVDTKKEPTSTEQHDSQTSSMHDQSSISFRENANTKEVLSTREVLVYSLGTAAFVITCSFMCIAFICFHRGKTRQQIEHSTIQPENQVNEDSNSGYSLYEQIDEGAIYDDNVLDDDDENSENKYGKTESEDSTLNSEKSGYLLPFTSIIPNHGKVEHPYSRGSTISSLSNHIEKDLQHINSYEQLQTEDLNTQSQSEYTQLHGVQYLELLDIRKKQTNTEYFESCCDSRVINITHKSRNFRKCYSNNDISSEVIFGAFITSKNKTEIRRCYSEY